jgi:hypothetical protein
MARTFFRGVPTEVDVRRLEDAFGLPAEDTLIEYAAIEEALQLAKESNRFETVVRAWRDKLYDQYNLLLVAVRGQGLKAATPDTRVSVASKKQQQGRKLIMRGTHIAVRTDAERLSDGKRRELRQFLIDVPTRLRLQESLSMK